MSLVTRSEDDLCLLSHLMRTGAIQDLLIVSERQMVKGISRIVAMTGREAAQVSYRHSHCG